MTRFSIRMICEREQGTALLTAMLLTFVMLMFTLALLQVAVAHSNDSLSASENLKAMLAAEGGINEAIADINRGGAGNVTGKIGGVAFDARAVRVADRFLIDSVGTNSAWMRAVRTVVAPALPVPGSRAAITIVGPTGRASALDTVTTAGGNILISGLGGGVPAVGIEDPSTYTAVMEDVIPKIAAGVISANTFRGTPEVNYTAQDGSSAAVPIVALPTPEWDAEKLEALRLRLVERAEALAAAPTLLFGAGSTDFNAATRILSGVTVIDGVDLNANANLEGRGTLIIRGGDLNIATHGNFHWQGTVILLGEAGAGAALTNSGGTVTVEGAVIVLGNQGSQSAVTIGSGLGNSNTNFLGATLLMAGTQANEGAHFNVGSGGVNMHGWVGVFGGSSQITATNRTGVFEVLGSMTVGVDGSHPEDGRADLDFDGNVHVQFNENLYERAIQQLLVLLQQMNVPPPSYSEVGWMEISPLVAYQASADATNYTGPSTTQLGSFTQVASAATTSSTSTSASTSTSTSPVTSPSTSTSTTTGGQGALRVGGDHGASASHGAGS